MNDCFAFVWQCIRSSTFLKCARAAVEKLFSVQVTLSENILYRNGLRSGQLGADLAN